ncbi:MAG: hypothetical protein BWY09_02302 [Candidatus Hydrogenedentes bacterium ADurb.Bin179]|nr:MAG: hypothetical protein BWY09_02302 [Candidatus Hydrogenedentes bacterium ADurb.Bin179]
MHHRKGIQRRQCGFRGQGHDRRCVLVQAEGRVPGGRFDIVVGFPAQMGDKIVQRFRERVACHNLAQQELFIHGYEVQGIGFVDFPVDNRGLLIAAQLPERDRFRQHGLDILRVCGAGAFRGVQRLIPTPLSALELRRQRVSR